MVCRRRVTSALNDGSEKPLSVFRFAHLVFRFFFRPPGVPFCTLLIITILLMFRSFFALVVLRRAAENSFFFSFDFFYPKEREIMLLHGVGLPRCSALLRWLKS